MAVHQTASATIGKMVTAQSAPALAHQWV